MSLTLIEELLIGDGVVIRDLAANEAVLVGFLTLAKGIDDLPDMIDRFYEPSRSLYQVTSSGRSIGELTTILSDFFGRPVKTPGKSLPATLRVDPVVKYLGGLREEQALFLKKLKTGAFYGALWPWRQDTAKIEIHLGFFSPKMSAGDYKQLETLVQKFLSKKKIEAVSGVGGQIHGISLPSFLQMSEMEAATYTLKVSGGSRTGYLHLDDGHLIAAQYETQHGNAAAYRIISWENVAIEIEAAAPGRAREIHEPLMHMLMESLKIKDEARGEPDPPPPAAPKTQPFLEKTEGVTPVDHPPPQKTVPPKEKVKPAALAPVETRAVGQPAASVDATVEKTGDRRDGAGGRRASTGKWLFVCGMVGLIVIGVVGGWSQLKKRQVHGQYNQLLADLAAANALDAQIVLMIQYLETHPLDDHRAELEARLEAANIAIEKQDYEKTIADVGRLPVDENYETKALSLYTAFLTKYPDSAYAGQIKEGMGNIRQFLAKAFFGDLKNISVTDYPARITACRKYLERFPDGAERDAVDKMLTDLANEYGRAVESRVADCDDQNNWDACIARCDQFLATFTQGTEKEKIQTLRTLLQDKQDVMMLTAKAALVADDFAKAKAVYTKYLAEHPDTTQKKTISRRIAELEADLARQAEWEQTAASAADPASDITSRIKRLDVYLKTHPSGPYTAAAKQLRAELDPELQDTLRAQRRLETEKQQAMARQQAEQAHLAREALRIQKLHGQVSIQLRQVASRFIDNGDGTVTDKLTGLTWCRLDSHLDLGKCLTYAAAKAYVQSLNTQGHADWRLPTAGELAAIYKSRPFFPGSGAEWYWTSESFAQGYHRVVAVVTSQPESVFTRISKDEESCGAVRAVRP